jgi:hypothetical protein
MKISFALSLLILVIGSMLSWQERQRHATARTSHDQLVAEAVQFGIPLDPAQTRDAARITKRERGRERQQGDKMADAKAAAVEQIAIIEELDAIDKKGGQPDEATQKRITASMDRIKALDPAQLKIFIAEIRAAKGLEGKNRDNLINFSILMIAGDHPQTALALLTDSPESLKGNGLGKAVMTSSLAKWATNDPASAIEWVRANVAKFPDVVDDRAKGGIISGAAINDPRLAFKLIAELGIKDGNDAIRDIAAAAKTPEERTATLTALRAHLATLPEGTVRDKASATAFQSLGENAAKEGFEAGSKWLENAALTPEQLAKVCDFSPNMKREESGKWVEWLGSKLPIEKSKNSISEMVQRWTEGDYQAAGKWLAVTPNGPAKNTSIRSYAETVAQYEPKTAAQWAMTLPAGKDRDETLKNIYQKWPANDEAAKQAFKKLHGIQ